ncbi:MAG: multiheme c-type cytochrome [Pseudomonadota bacterium]
MKNFIFFIITLLFIVATLFFLNNGVIYKLIKSTAQFIPYQQTPTGIPSLKAKDCAACHIEIYQEWQQSLHSKAFIDPFFSAYHKKDKGDATCLVCHTPLENQSPVLLVSKSLQYNDLQILNNPKFDPQLQQEGVTCAGCHVRNDIIYGPYKKDSLNAPHPVAYDAKFTSKVICKQCHEVPSKDFSLLKEGVCSTGMESDTGIWAEKGYICQDCHMPAITRPLVQGFPARTGRKHLWPGGYSNTQLQKVFSFSASKKKDQLTISITNSGAGHKAPTGDPDRFIILDFFWLDHQQIETALGSIKFKRQIVWQPIMFVWSDNRLAPGESTQLTVRIPSARGKLYVNGTYHVMSKSSLKRLKNKFALKDEWPIQRKFINKQVIEIN